jgi:hypothetical protein
MKGHEVAETVSGEWITRVAITEIERSANRGGVTALSTNSLTACHTAMNSIQHQSVVMHAATKRKTQRMSKTAMSFNRGGQQSLN